MLRASDWIRRLIYKNVPKNRTNVKKRNIIIVKIDENEQMNQKNVAKMIQICFNEFNKNIY